MSRSDHRFSKAAVLFAAALCLALAGCASNKKAGLGAAPKPPAPLAAKPQTPERWTYKLDGRALETEVSRADFGFANLLGCAFHTIDDPEDFVSTEPEPGMRRVDSRPGTARYVDLAHATLLTLTRDRCEIEVATDDVEGSAAALTLVLEEEWWGVFETERLADGTLVVPLQSPNGLSYELVVMRNDSPFLKDGKALRGLSAALIRVDAPPVNGDQDFERGFEQEYDQLAFSAEHPNAGRPKPPGA